MLRSVAAPSNAAAHGQRARLASQALRVVPQRLRPAGPPCARDMRVKSGEGGSLFTPEFAAVLASAMQRNQDALDKTGSSSGPEEEQLTMQEEMLMGAIGSTHQNLRLFNFLHKEIETAIGRETKQLERLRLALKAVKNDAAYYRTLESMRADERQQQKEQQQMQQQLQQHMQQQLLESTSRQEVMRAEWTPPEQLHEQLPEQVPEEPQPVYGTSSWRDGWREGAAAGAGAAQQVPLDSGDLQESWRQGWKDMAGGAGSNSSRGSGGAELAEHLVPAGAVSAAAASRGEGRPGSRSTRAPASGLSASAVAERGTVLVAERQERQEEQEKQAGSEPAEVDWRNNWRSLYGAGGSSAAGADAASGAGSSAGGASERAPAAAPPAAPSSPRRDAPLHHDWRSNWRDTFTSGEGGAQGGKALRGSGDWERAGWRKASV